MSPGRNRGYRETPRRPAGQAFLNTLRLKPRSDELAGPRALSNWLSRHGLLPAGFALDPDDVARARDARAGLRALLAANSGASLDQGNQGPQRQVVHPALRQQGAGQSLAAGPEGRRAVMGRPHLQLTLPV